MSRIKRVSVLSGILAIALSIVSMPGYSEPVSFGGPLAIVLEDTGGGVYSGTPVGTNFSGFIDDISGGGQITNGTTLTPFSCCIAAGGLSVSNDNVLNAEDVALINSLLGAVVFSPGDLIDSIDIEGDITTAGGGRIEIGVSYLFASNTFSDENLSNYPFDPNDVFLAVYFIFEEDINDVTVYDAIGVINSAGVSTSVCDIQMTQSAYNDGDTVTANVFRLANLSGVQLATELKVWLGGPGFAPVPIFNLGSDGTFVLQAGTDLDFGPLPLLPVTAALPRGGYEFSCRLLDPTTGRLLAEDRNLFTLQ